MPHKNLNLRRAVRQLKWVPVEIDVRKLPESNCYDVRQHISTSINSIASGKWIMSIQNWHAFGESVHHCRIAFEKPADATMVSLKWA